MMSELMCVKRGSWTSRPRTQEMQNVNGGLDVYVPDFEVGLDELSHHLDLKPSQQLSIDGSRNSQHGRGKKLKFPRGAM